jgi:hypothetical protein
VSQELFKNKEQNMKFTWTSLETIESKHVAARLSSRPWNNSEFRNHFPDSGSVK